MTQTSFIPAMAGTFLLATSALADTAGYAVTSFDASHHDKSVEGAIWYPAAVGSPTAIVNQNPVFFGVDVAQDADARSGSHPVVVLSHGMGGNYRSMTWLGAGLAQRGAVVVTVNHPNSSTWDFDIRDGLDHWTRAQDLSAALDQLVATPRFEGKLDMDRVMAAGFSYGGWTALSLGGLTANLAAYADHCAMYLQESSHCSDIQGAGVDLADLNTSVFDASYKDQRISMVAAIDPALHFGLNDTHIAPLVDDVQLIALGNGKDRLFATDFSDSGSGFGAKLPDATVVDLVPASHFMALPLCKPMGEAILKEENDDPVCTDPEGADRAAVHAAIIDSIAKQLGL